MADSKGATALDWCGTASMRGTVAAVGGRILDAEAQMLIGQTFSNVKSAEVGAVATI